MILVLIIIAAVVVGAVLLLLGLSLLSRTGPGRRGMEWIGGRLSRFSWVQSLAMRRLRRRMVKTGQDRDAAGRKRTDLELVAQTLEGREGAELRAALARMTPAQRRKMSDIAMAAAQQGAEPPASREARRRSRKGGGQEAAPPPSGRSGSGGRRSRRRS